MRGVYRRQTSAIEVFCGVKRLDPYSSRGNSNAFFARRFGDRILGVDEIIYFFVLSFYVYLNERITTHVTISRGGVGGVTGSTGIYFPLSYTNYQYFVHLTVI